MEYCLSLDHTYVERVEGPDVLRVLAHPSQVPLIALQRKEGRTIEVVSLNHFPEAMAQDPDPEVVLSRMRAVDAPAACGGWRLLTEPELTALEFSFCTEGLALELAPPTYFKLLKRHPLVRAGVGFAFHRHALPPALLQLMSAIFDIRRFADPCEALQFNRLKSFFRTHGPQALFKADEKSRSVVPFTDKEERAMLACNSWQCPHHSKQDPDVTARTPQAFMFRDMDDYMFEYTKKGLPEEKVVIMSMWKATNRFLTFVRLLWLDRLGQVIFDPNVFFKRPDEAIHFSSYIKNLDEHLDK